MIHINWVIFYCFFFVEKTIILISISETEECFIPLMVNGEKYYRLESNIFGNISLSVQLPSNVECEHCVLRWHWRGGKWQLVCTILFIQMLIVYR